MQNFIDKWKKDKRFQTKIKLSIYTLFVVFVAIFATSNNNQPINNLQDTNKHENTNISNTNKIEIPEEYNYKISVIINEKEYKFIGNKTATKETIKKEINGLTTNYIYQNDNYYVEEDPDLYVLTTKKEVYDIVDNKYIQLDTINEYLSKSEKTENEYRIYLKDIILNNNSEEYIIIKKIENKIIIDYTKLLNYFDENIEKYLVNIEIE